MSSAVVPNSLVSKQTVKKSVSPKKSAKGKVPRADIKSKSKTDHPPYKSMIKKALNELKEKKGASRLAILKFIMSHFHLGENPVKINAHLKMALKKGVANGSLRQTKGIGASGSFILREGKESKATGVSKEVEQVKLKAKKVMKATGVKKPSAKKATPKKKSSDKKVVSVKALAATAPTTSPTITLLTTTKTKFVKEAKSPKKLKVVKKLPIKKASTRKPKTEKKPKAPGGKKLDKNVNVGSSAVTLNP